MKINKVELKNYRSHSDCSITFTDGINLLLGKNGAGKSSILEAIGFALFNTGIRTKNDESIKINEKNALIQVEFVGNDGIEYIVERKISKSSSTHRLYKKGETSSRIENTTQILNKIIELTGIIDINGSGKISKSIVEDIYENVITASQNQITGIFTAQGSSREQIFNRVFDTEIYNKIFKDFSKNAEDKYKEHKILKSQEITGLEAKLKDNDLLNDELNNFTVEHNNLSSEINSVKNEINSLTQELNLLKDKKNTIEKINANLKNLNKLTESTTENINLTQARLENSENALKIIIETKESYSQYNLVTIKLKELRELIKKLEKLEKDKQKLEKDNNSNIQSQTRITSETTALNNELSEKTSNLSKLEQYLNELEKNKSEQDNEVSKLYEEMNKYVNQQSQFTKFHEELKNSIKQLENLQIKFNEKEKGKVDFEEIKKEIFVLTNNKNILSEKEIEKQKLENEITQFKTRLKELEEANKKLSAGKCPYLKEDCENIKKGISIQEYFDNRKKDLQFEIEQVTEKLAQYKNVANERTELENKLTLLYDKKLNGEKLIQELEKIKLQLNNFEKIIELSDLNLLNFVKPYSENFAGIDESKDYNLVVEFFNNKITDLKSIYSSKNTLVNQYAQGIKKLSSDILNLKKNISEINNKIKNNSLSLISINKSIDENKSKISEFNEKLLELPDLKQEESEKNSHLENLKGDYDKYVANEAASKEIDLHKNQLQKLNNDFVKLNKEKEDYLQKLNILNSEYSEDKYKEAESKIKDKTEKKESLNDKISEIKTNIELKKKEISANKEIAEQIKEIKDLIKKLDKKLELTKVFRENINNMGRMVATRLLNKIEVLATENYRRISNKNEEIKWNNGEDEKYEVLLKRGNEIRNFKQLSGGEQVSVALALRSAMASTMTKANFAIFDEPTNNLDSERRIALSESLKEILKNLNQALIVTHDDSFREMAQNTIFL